MRGRFVEEFYDELERICTDRIELTPGGPNFLVNVPAGQWHTVRVDLSETGFWSGTIHEIRMDFFSSCGPDDRMYLKEFKILTE